MSTAELICEDNHLKISNFDYHQKDSYYNTTFDLEVRSNVFCGVAPCEYHMKEFQEFVHDLSEVYDFKKQKAVLSEIGYGSRVTFEADKTGHIEIGGEIYGEAMAHTLRFSFFTDQTVLGQFVSQLQKLLKT